MSQSMPEIKRKYVVPGELIAEGQYQAESNVIKDGEKFYSTRVGMAEMGRDGVRVIPLSGAYFPRLDDMVVGNIVDHSAFAWEVDINSPFFAVLPAASVFGRDFSPANQSLSETFAKGDYVICNVASFDRTRDPLVSVSGPGLGKVTDGKIVKISPTKVPRLIGKKGLMIRAIEDATNCRLTIGQNGIVVVNGPDDGLIKVMNSINLIEEEAYMADLTQKVQVLLEDGKAEK